MDRRSVEEVKHLGIDEKSFRKGQFYVSLLYDLNTSRVLEVVADRTTESATTLWSTLPEQRRNEVAAVAVDMWVPFIQLLRRLERRHCSRQVSYRQLPYNNDRRGAASSPSRSQEEKAHG